MRTKKDQRGNPLPQEKKETLLTLLMAGDMSTKEIATKVGVARSTVYDCLYSFPLLFWNRKKED